jgi:tungstate transport system ATP-binding protein
VGFLDPSRLDPRPADVTPPPVVLELAGVKMTYGGEMVLDVPALAVNEGEILTVIGPNGSGKSTLLRIAGLLERPTRGVVQFRGRPVDAADSLAERRRMAMVFQHPLLADMTVAQNVKLGLAFRGAADERGTRVARWLERLGIAPLADRRARSLSGGQAQRVALARALVLEPEVLLLDEPFAGLDAPTRAELLPDLGAILRRDRVTTMLVTHDRGEAQALGDRVAVLMAGRIAQVDEAPRVFQAPASEAVARFIGVETVVTGRVIGRDAGVTVVDVAGTKLEVAAPATIGDEVRIGLRPEDVTLLLATDVAPISSARNYLTGTIVRVTPSTPAVRVVVDVGFPLVATVTARSVADLGLSEGVRIAAAFKASAAQLIGSR